MKIKFISKSEPKKTHEYEIESYNEIYHIGKYKLKKNISTLLSGNSHIYVDIEVNKKETELDYYLPSLYADIDNHKIPSIRIQTSSYGALDLDHIKNYIKAYEHAIEVAKTIENSDLLK